MVWRACWKKSREKRTVDEMKSLFDRYDLIPRPLAKRRCFTVILYPTVQRRHGRGLKYPQFHAMSYFIKNPLIGAHNAGFNFP
jgi:hypothetical protein